MASSERLKVQVNLSTENIEWFRSTYPSENMSWIVDMMLTHFRELHIATPSDLAKLAAEETKKMGEV